MDAGFSPISGMSALEAGGGFRGILTEGWGSAYEIAINRNKAAALGIPAGGSTAAQLHAFANHSINIGIPAAGSGPKLILQAALSEDGIPQSAVNWTYTGSYPNSLAAFNSGQVDAIVAAPAVIAEITTNPVLVQFSQIKALDETPYNMVWANDTFIINHPRIVQEYVDSLVEAREYTLSHTKTVASKLGGLFSPANIFDPSLIRTDVVTTIKTFTAAPATMALPKAEFQRTQSLANLALAAMSPPKPASSLTDSEFFDNTFINAAIKKFKLSWPKG
jgi:ABC-type nitrate/sulfonate/bicarbonate transport system substrate-binding protein